MNLARADCGPEPREFVILVIHAGQINEEERGPAGGKRGKDGSGQPLEMYRLRWTSESKRYKQKAQS
jgi:hypothetical protein